MMDRFYPGRYLGAVSEKNRFSVQKYIETRKNNLSNLKLINFFFFFFFVKLLFINIQYYTRIHY